jgi:hypothetical protein
VVNLVTECQGYWQPKLHRLKSSLAGFKSNFRAEWPETGGSMQRMVNHVACRATPESREILSFQGVVPPLRNRDG